MKIEVKIQTIDIDTLLPSHKTTKIKTLIETLQKIEQGNPGYDYLSLYPQRDCYQCCGISELDLYGQRDETKEEREIRLNKARAAKERVESQKAQTREQKLKKFNELKQELGL